METSYEIPQGLLVLSISAIILDKSLNFLPIDKIIDVFEKGPSMHPLHIKISTKKGLKSVFSIFSMQDTAPSFPPTTIVLRES